ncbi:MAG TPA: tRNA pseudouridine(55) synthase TruB, partial [Bacteroidota bacterium]|nr:tRNA pseudouridine(55) synthase TruB [Bacteroidota bacterium]
MPLKETWDFNGKGELLTVDKPLEWTSLDVVKKIRSMFNISRAGHAGTLDPKATGLLIICTGQKTKSIAEFVGLEKEYMGVFRLGIRTPSFDSETEITERKDASGVTADYLRESMESFVGKQTQVPPMFSAAKYGGKPLYKYARKGKTVERSPKDIEIKLFTPVVTELPNVEFRVVCSKGTYIRSLVDDLGQKLGCGACLLSL